MANKLLSASAKVSWSSSNKKVATVSSTGKITGKKPALRGSAENNKLHVLYPLGVTIRPDISLVRLDPIKTVENISAE